MPRLVRRALVQRGCLLALALVLALAGVVQRPGREPSSPATVSASLLTRAQFLADSLFGTGRTWKTVSRVQTPWGEVVRVRPTVGALEVRGSDLVVSSVRPGEDSSAAAGAGAQAFFSSPAPAPAPLPHRGSRSEPALSLAWRCRSLLTEREWSRLEAWARVVEIGPHPLLEAGAEVQTWFASRAPGGEWQLWAEAHFDPVLDEPASVVDFWSTLPWSTGRPPTDSAAPVRLRIDPENGSVLEARDDRFLEGAEPRAHLFDPNPVAVSGRGDLRDGSEVDSYRSWVELPRLDGSGRLRGSWVETRSDRPPLAEEPSLVYDYPSYDPRFEETMAYYHGDRGIARTEELGFSGLFRSPIFLRVHGTAADNSWYSRPTREIVLGDGGVDDAEDADIILHELGHAIHDALVPGFGDGDSRAISEGFSDFWAATLTGDPCVGDWDATSYSPPCLRTTEQNAVYPASIVGRPHVDGQIWSGLLWDLRSALGAHGAEQLALAALLEQDPETTWPEAAEALLRAAAQSGLDRASARATDALVRRGLLARQLAIELGPEESWELRFLAPGRLLGNPVHSLGLDGDGTIRFGAAGVPIAKFPESAPALVAAGLSPAEIAPPGLALACTVLIEAGVLTLEQSWRDQGTELMAVRIEWDMVGGSLSWTYQRAPAEAARLSWFAGAAISNVEPLGVDWLAVPRDGIGGLASCSGSFEDPTKLVGARFRMLPEATGLLFRLQQTGPARPEGAGPLLVVFPNPGPGRTAVRLFLDTEEDAEVALYDAQGRRVRELAEPARRPAGLSEWTWNGRDDRGKLMPSGRYFVRAVAGGRVARTSVLFLR